ncbi:MAG: serine/threonine protein kinase, partial [Planctomycetota bacterium]
MESADSTDRHPVEELAEAFVAQLRTGLTPSIEDWAQSHPEHAATIRAVFPSLMLVEKVSAQDGTITSASHHASAPPADATPLPRAFDDFAIVRLIGRGGMGVVYEAIQGSLQRTVAL